MHAEQALDRDDELFAEGGNAAQEGARLGGKVLVVDDGRCARRLRPVGRLTQITL